MRSGSSTRVLGGTRTAVLRAPALALVLVAIAGGMRSASACPSAVLSPAGAAAGRVFLSAEEALVLAFPKCELTRTTVYLTDAQRERATDLTGEKIEVAIARPWTAKRDGKLVGTAYLDTHKVRTLSETILVVVDPQGRVGRIELLAFAEPEEYIPRGNWYGQFIGKELDRELRLKASIRPVSGASLTAAATTTAVRRVLALHKTIELIPPKSPAGGTERP